MNPFPPEDLQPIGSADLVAVRLAAAGLGDWRYAGGQLHGRFVTPSFRAGLSLVAQLGDEAERSQHHPDVDLRYGHVDVRMHSHDVAAITMRDVRLARAISAIAAGLGAAAAVEGPGEPREIEG